MFFVVVVVVVVILLILTFAILAVALILIIRIVPILLLALVLSLMCLRDRSNQRGHLGLLIPSPPLSRRRPVRWFLILTSNWCAIYLRASVNDSSDSLLTSSMLGITKSLGLSLVHASNLCLSRSIGTSG